MNTATTTGARAISPPLACSPTGSMSSRMALGFASLATGPHCIPRSQARLRTGVSGQQGDETVLEEAAGGVAQLPVGQEGERQGPPAVEVAGETGHAVQRTGLGPQLSFEGR